MYAIEPKTDCPHFAQGGHLLPPESWRYRMEQAVVENSEQDTKEDDNETPVTVLDVASAPCSLCGEAEENWICLGCKNIGCSRYKNGDALRHFEDTGHSLSISFSDLSTNCYLCDSYVKCPLGKPADLFVYYSKFGELPPDAEEESAHVDVGTLASALEAVPYETLTSADDENLCAICLKTYQAGEKRVTLPRCGHNFHRPCLLTWVLRTNECPNCRQCVLEGWARSPVRSPE